MAPFLLVWRNLMRRPMRSILTICSLVVAIFLICGLRTLITTMNAGVENADSRRLAVMSAVPSVQQLALLESLDRAGHRTVEVLAQLHLPHIPSREECLAQARALFARTPTLDEIVDRAYEMLLTSVGAHLVAAPVPVRP